MPRLLKNLPMAPAERALKVLGGRWKVFLLAYLFEGTRRLSDPSRLVPLASRKVILQQLREMEQHGIVTRKVFAQVPPRVDYTVTALGRSLQPILLSLCAWGTKHAAELDDVEVTWTPSTAAVRVARQRS